MVSQSVWTRDGGRKRRPAQLVVCTTDIEKRVRYGMRATSLRAGAKRVVRSSAANRGGVTSWRDHIISCG